MYYSSSMIPIIFSQCLSLLFLNSSYIVFLFLSVGVRKKLHICILCVCLEQLIRNLNRRTKILVRDFYCLLNAMRFIVIHSYGRGFQSMNPVLGKSSVSCHDSFCRKDDIIYL